jgi:FAD-dependent oxidoreductase family protein
MLETIRHETEVCVVGGGMAGVCAALAAARRGARVILMQDRPMLGGNSSRECRVHVCGADRANGIPNMRETGILEEMRLESARRNPNRSYSLWDMTLYDKAMREPNLELLLNCCCCDAQVEPGRILSVTGLQSTTQTFHTVEASIFIDCSGDSILAPLSGAEFRVGREASSEFGESIAPETADLCTMGMTCYVMASEYDTPQPYTPPDWIHTFERCEDIPHGRPGHNNHKYWDQGHWWVEYGGQCDTIRDSERIREELLKLTLGVWDHTKNRCPDKEAAEYWGLDWIQILPARRESRRYVGDHILTQLDLEAEGRFDDIVAYGGWTMDDHHPDGFYAVRHGAPATIFHKTPSPYGIPYRTLYSRNIVNLMFAGRNTSCTHSAMSSTRVMGTCSSMGQAVGTAAAIAVARGIAPSDVGDRIDELQQTLLADDCYLPWVPQRANDLTNRADLQASQGDPAAVRDGTNRPVGQDMHAWTCRPNDWLALNFGEAQEVAAVTLVLNTGLDQNISLSHTHGGNVPRIPEATPKAFRIEGLCDGDWRVLQSVVGNYQRLVRLEIGERVKGLRFTLDETRGADESGLHAVWVE